MATFNSIMNQFVYKSTVTNMLIDTVDQTHASMYNMRNFNRIMDRVNDGSIPSNSFNIFLCAEDDSSFAEFFWFFWESHIVFGNRSIWESSQIFSEMRRDDVVNLVTETRQNERNMMQNLLSTVYTEAQQDPPAPPRPAPPRQLPRSAPQVPNFILEEAPQDQPRPAPTRQLPRPAPQVPNFILEAAQQDPQAPRFVMEEIPVRPARNTWTSEEFSHDIHEDCCICLKSVKRSDTTRTTCGHVFCTVCLQEWISRSRTCPMCRQNV
jgi:hypothetical protein